ncbi:MAG: segregation/condensation protein A [bacterium]
MQESLEEQKRALSSYEVKQASYQGPFDLLLGIIQAGRLPIFEISLAELTDQYLAEMKELKKFSVIVAAEFLVMAAYLLELKSKSLLPKQEAEAEEEAQAEVESDLIDRLMEYKVFKDVASVLRERKEYFKKVHTRFMLPQVDEIKQKFVLTDVSLEDLVSAFRLIWEVARDRESKSTIADEVITTEEKIAEMLQLLSESPEGLALEAFITRQTVLEVVVTFLATLELIRQQRIKAVQGKAFGAINIVLMQGGAN